MFEAGSGIMAKEIGDLQYSIYDVFLFWGLFLIVIGNGKFGPLTLWNDIELRYRITASQWT